MTSFNDPNLRRKIIMDSYRNPKNLNTNNNTKIKLIGQSKTCADNVNIYFDIKDDIIQNISFDGAGCAVCISSIDLFIDFIKNKSTEEVKQSIIKFHHLLETGNEDPSLDKLNVFSNVKTHMNRVNCAKVGTNALLEYLKK